MDVTLSLADLDRLAPFVMVVRDGTISHAGPTLSTLAPRLVGARVQDHFEIHCGDGTTAGGGFLFGVEGSITLNLMSADIPIPIRFQVLGLRGGDAQVFVGALDVDTLEEPEQLGLSDDDFSPLDLTPALLRLRREQEQSVSELRAVNHQLERTAHDLRLASRAQGRAESRYRRLVELQPLVMYIDRLGTAPVGEFVSPGVESWLGYSAEQWMLEPGFFFTIVHPEDRARVWDAHVRAEQCDGPFDLEFRLLTADGRTVWTRAVDSVVRDEDDPDGKRIGFMLDVSTAKAAELELRQTMSRLTTLLTHMQSGVLVEDAQRRVMMANDALCGIFRADVQPESLIGLPASAAIARLVPDSDDPTAVLRRTDELLARRWPAADEVLELADGRVLEFDLQPIVDDGADLGALWVVRDVTTRVRTEQTLARARDEAVAASTAKSQFLASMSHEIRTPMHGVLATIDLLQTTSLDAEQRELIEVVSGSASALVEIINDILDLQKVESGRIELVQEQFSVRAMVGAVVDLLSPQARGKGIELNLRFDPTVPDSLVGDPLRLRQVLLNLVGNAVKFTHDGSVLVAVGVGSVRDTTVGLRVAIRDTGDGIPAERLSGIFDPFVQARPGLEGTGLGLAIADQLVGLMGGRLTVRSTVGSGTTFEFEICLSSPDGAGPTSSSSEAPATAKPESAVLVVEHSAAVRGLLMRQLARIGVPARAVATAAEALGSLENASPYGMVLLDVTLPGSDAAATVAAIRDRLSSRSRRLPVIGLVAGGSERDRELCRRAGVEWHLDKPVDIGELRAVVKRWLESGQEPPSTTRTSDRARRTMSSVSDYPEGQA